MNVIEKIVKQSWGDDSVVIGMRNGKVAYNRPIDKKHRYVVHTIEYTSKGFPYLAQGKYGLTIEAAFNILNR